LLSAENDNPDGQFAVACMAKNALEPLPMLAARRPPGTWGWRKQFRALRCGQQHFGMAADNFKFAAVSTQNSTAMIFCKGKSGLSHKKNIEHKFSHEWKLVQ
jgi:hypothetical protein